MNEPARTTIEVDGRALYRHEAESMREAIQNAAIVLMSAPRTAQEITVTIQLLLP